VEGRGGLTDRRVSFAVVDVALQFDVPGAKPLEVVASELTYVSSDGLVGEVQLECELTPQAYGRVDREQLFHLDPEVRGLAAERFVASDAVRLTLRLAAAELPALLAEAPDPPAGAALLRRRSIAGGDAALLSSAAWFALSVTSPAAPHGDEPTDGGRLARGYATTWAAPPRRLTLPMLTVAAEVLEDHGWEYEELDDDTVLGWPMTGAEGDWMSFAVAREAEGRFAVYSVLPDRIAAPWRDEAAQLVTRINWGLPVGNWELDLDDGTVRCKTSIDLAGERLSLALAARVIERNLAVVDAYAGEFARFAAGHAV
jgi:hypothetical protein